MVRQNQDKKGSLKQSKSDSNGTKNSINQGFNSKNSKNRSPQSFDRNEGQEREQKD